MEANVSGKNKRKNSKVLTIVLIVIALILMLLVGIVTGLLVSGKSITQIISSTKEIIKNEEIKNEKAQSKKIDESKSWVYDGEYLKEKQEKIKTNKETNITYKSSKEIKLPYININSEDAKIVNDEIKVFAEKAYSEFGKALQGRDAATNQVITRDNWFSFTGFNYETYVNDNILSVIIQEHSVAVPGDISNSYVTYNFDLETLKQVSITDILESYGFKSQVDLNNELKIQLKNLEVTGQAVTPEESIWDGNRFFIKNGKINVIVPSLSMSEYMIEVTPDVLQK